jgi:cyclase
MSKSKTVFAITVLIFQAATASAQWESRIYPGSDFEGPAFVFEEVADDIYQARGAGNAFVGSNTAIIINEQDVVIVDSNISPASAAALAEELKTITDKPIKYVINTHFHFDHAHGNQIYPKDVHVIGHEFTYEMLSNGGSVGRSYVRFKDLFANAPGGAEGQQGLIPTPPNLTLTDKMTLYRGGREIQLMFFGRGHTGGDVVVYLPAEKILFSGDLLLEGVPFMGDAFLQDWVETLESLKALDFDTVVPGHGHPFSDRTRIDRQQELLTDLWQRIGENCDKKISAAQSAEILDMTDHSSAYAQIDAPGVAIATVERVYELRGCAQ